MRIPPGPIGPSSTPKPTTEPLFAADSAATEPDADVLLASVVGDFGGAKLGAWGFHLWPRLPPLDLSGEPSRSAARGIEFRV